ncbi:MAG: hypothetical protein WAN65_12355, partial [Candidatus Sulfotelmatobacter sp.]
GFLLDRLGQDCHPLQFLRELTQNGIEAVGRTGAPGKIIWDVDWNTYDLSNPPIFKLCVIDTGDGMTGDNLEKYINRLSSSLSKQSLTGNYGVGAKITAATKSPHGVIYISWRDGEGNMIHLARDPNSGQYGLKQFRLQDGSYTYHMPVEEDIKPDCIKDHGTMVILLGKSAEDDTMAAPIDAASPSRWIAKYLNSRYFTFPEGIDVRARQGWENPRNDTDNNVLRKLTGQKNYLDEHKITSGVVELVNAKAHWWILMDEKALTSNSGHIESSGHIAALYRNELYEHETGRGGMSKLQHFGVVFGYRQVVIYIEPNDNKESVVTTNTARTHLSINGMPLPWAEWALQFREFMPGELKEFIDEKGAAASSTDHSQSIRERLKSILSLYKLTRYRPSPNGEFAVDESQSTFGGKPTSNQSNSTRGARDGGGGGRPGGRSGNIYSFFEKKHGSPAKRVTPDPFPHVVWVQVSDGTRAGGFLEDRAAKYLIDLNTLQINGDFRGFIDMIDHWTHELGDGSGRREVVESACRNWFEQALVETVIGVQALRNSKEWSTAEIEKALSPEALTAAVMQRYHINVAVKRELGSKLGKLSTA